jgi:toxin HigB-1
MTSASFGSGKRTQPTRLREDPPASREARQILHGLSICVIPEHVVRSFADMVTADLFYGEPTARARRISVDVVKVALRKLAQLDAALRLDDLRVPPGNRLEALPGDRAGCHSVRLNEKWRVAFRWQADGAYDVELTDYH